jgi:hypothetical protein
VDQNPSPVKLDELDLSNLQARACNAVSLLVKSLRGPAPTHADLKTACGAANNAARNLNQLCVELFPADASEERRKPGRRGGKGNTERRAADFERIAGLEAENAELLAALQGMLREFGGDTGGIGAKGRCAALCAAHEVIGKTAGSAS